MGDSKLVDHRIFNLTNNSIN